MLRAFHAFRSIPCFVPLFTARAFFNSNERDCIISSVECTRVQCFFRCFVFVLFVKLLSFFPHFFSPSLLSVFLAHFIGLFMEFLILFSMQNWRCIKESFSSCEEILSSLHLALYFLHATFWTCGQARPVLTSCIRNSLERIFLHRQFNLIRLVVKTFMIAPNSVLKFKAWNFKLQLNTEPSKVFAFNDGESLDSTRLDSRLWSVS